MKYNKQNWEKLQKLATTIYYVITIHTKIIYILTLSYQKMKDEKLMMNVYHDIMGEDKFHVKLANYDQQLY